MAKVKIAADGGNGMGWWADVRYVSNGKRLPAYDGPVRGTREGALKDAFLWASSMGHEVTGYDLVKSGPYYDLVPKVTR